MDTAYRKRQRSDEVVSSANLTPGLTVWVEVQGGNGRVPRICTGPNGELVTTEEWRRRQKEKVARNRSTKPYIKDPLHHSNHSLRW